MWERAQRFLAKFSSWMIWMPSGPVVHLAVKYDTSDDAEGERFLEDFCSRIRLCYRCGLSPPLELASGKLIASDSGWGCMLRVTQMLLAQCFSIVKLGRDWRYSEVRDLAPGSAYLDIVSCFLDAPGAPFSLHRLVETGQRLFGKEPSQWFGPTSSAQSAGAIFKDLRASEFDDASLQDAALQTASFLKQFGCCVFEDGCIYKKEVLECFQNGASAVILFICKRFGLNSFNAELYREGLKACFEMCQFQGLASGDNVSSAHFFTATHGEDLALFLDPHETLQALATEQDVVGTNSAPTTPDADVDAATTTTCASGRASAIGLRPLRPLQLRWTQLNPSINVGFLVQSAEEFQQLCQHLCDERRGEVFEVMEERPNYAARADALDDDGIVVFD